MVVYRLFILNHPANPISINTFPETDGGLHPSSICCLALV